MGGYDATGHLLESDKQGFKWVDVLDETKDFRVQVRGIMMNNYEVPDTDN